LPYKRFYLLFFALIVGCLNHQEIQVPEEIKELENLTVIATNEEPKQEVSFKKDVVYGDSEEFLIGRVGDIAVDSLSRLYIADVQKQLINVFEPDGKLITRLGSEGRGPGEFAYIKKIQIHDGLLFAADANFGIRRISVFSLNTLNFIKTKLVGRNENKYALPVNSYPGIHSVYIKSDGSYLAQYVANASKPSEMWQNVEHKGHIYMMDSSGEIASEKLFEFTEAILVNKPEGGFSPIEPFWGIAIKNLNGDNAFLLAGPEDFLIKEYSPEGVYHQALYYPIKKIPITYETAIEAGVHDYYVSRMKFMDLPSFWPVLRAVVIDDKDRLWVATTVENMKVYEWWVLEKNGELITQFQWPRIKPIQVVKNGNIYTRETDEETGLQQVVRYQVEFEEV